MIIKRNGKIFEVYSGMNIDFLFRSYDFNECVIWVENNGGFNETRKKTYSKSRKAG